MEGPRAPRDVELPQVLEFLNQSLRPQQTWSIASEYPTALNPSNLHNMRIITEKDRILSHAVMKPLIIKTPLLIYRAAAIGSVVTDEQHQGQGLSSQILESCLAEAKAQECDFAILWTNLHDFYRRFGFELAGFEESIQILEEFEAPQKNLRFLKGNRVAPEALLRLYSQHSVGSARTSEDIRKFLQIPKSELTTAWDSSGQLVAYAVIGKGADLTDYIHEWGGGVSALVALFAHLRKERARAITIILPSHSVNLMTAMQSKPVLINQGYLGMIKLVDTAGFFAKVHRAAKSLGISDLVLEKSESGFKIGFGTWVREIADEKELVPLLFGPAIETSFLPGAQEKWNRLFPLPLWLWGWDSI